MAATQMYNVEYNIPRIGLSMPGRQNRSSDGVIKITPGMDEPYEFVFGRQDGQFTNLMPFSAKLVFGNIQDLDHDSMDVKISNILLIKDIDIIQPYTDRIFVLLSNFDTSILYNAGTTFINWAIFLTNRNKQTFLAQIDNTGNRAGTVRFDMASGMPSANILTLLVAQINTPQNLVFSSTFGPEFH